jgi:integrase
MPARRKRPISVAVSGPDENGNFHAFLPVGRKPNGKPDRRHRMGKTREEVEDKIRELEDQLTRKAVPKAKRRAPHTVRTWFTHVLETPSLRPPSPRTVLDYWSRCRTWIFPHLGELVIEGDPELTSDDLDRLYTAMSDADCSDSHIHKTHAVIRHFLELLHQRGDMTRNPARMMKAPGSPAAPEMDPLTKEEAIRVVAAALLRPDPARWLIRLTTGQRQGEVLGFQWARLDTEDGAADFSIQLQRLPWSHGCADPHACGARPRKKAPHGLHRGPCEKDADGVCRRHRIYKAGEEPRPYPRGCPKPCPKNCDDHASTCPARTGGGLVLLPRKGMRLRRDGSRSYVVPLPGQVLEELRKHRVRQKRQRMLAGSLWEDHDLVFCDELGRPIDPRRDHEEWKELLREAGVREVRLHDARHTAATVALELGEDITVVQEILGHTDSRTTRRYTHVSTALARKATKRVGNALLGGVATGPATRRRRRPS